MKMFAKLFLVLALMVSAGYADDGHTGSGGYTCEGHTGSGGYVCPGHTGSGGLTDGSTGDPSESSTDQAENGSILEYMTSFFEQMF